MAKFLSSSVFLIGILGLILVLHIFSNALGWYQTVRFFDDFHHFLGGIWTAALFVYYFKHRFAIFDFKSRPYLTLIFALAFTALLGVGWELFEFCFDVVFANFDIPRAQLGLPDTMMDLVDDFMGSFLYTVILLGLYRREKS
jgi:hypothetical protein